MRELIRHGGRAVVLSCLPALILAGDATVTVDLKRDGVEVNPHMYGIFFEEINHAGDGGLYAELVRNRSFEDCNVPEGMVLENGFAVAKCRDRIPWPPKEPVPGWIVVGKDGSAANMALDKSRLLNRSQVTSLRLAIGKAGKTNPAGIANTGYWGMAFRAGASYLLSLHACSDAAFEGSLSAVLEDGDGKPLSDPLLLGTPGAEWKKLSGMLTAKGTTAQGRLALYGDAPGALWLDVVSLFPQDTWGQRPNGLRADLVQLLKDLKPGFIRFPGGCVTEGLTLEQGFAWKKTIGDIAERPGVWNAMWGYRRTDGLGYHELLQLAEDTGATALFCNNMGIACTIHTQGGVPCPPEQIRQYVDDTVDAIEYALGGPDTRWGAVRAKNGHPAPFDLKYVNIGNELNSREYTERYPAFHNAVKAKFPNVVTIAYAPVGRPKAPVEIKDLHDYRDDAWFLKNLNRFDDHDRKGPKLANMELAVRNRTNHTLHNALLEAAYMLGLERNADLVRLVSYAPLFLNVKDARWVPDLIHFDNHRSFGTPSYYAQMLFMHHRPDVTLPTSVEAAEQLYALAGKDRQRGEVILKIVNLGDERVVRIALNGATEVGETGTEIVLTSASDLDQNTFETPRKVAPVTREIQLEGPAFSSRVAARSMTVFRVRVK